jgi:ureidoacrylate peracid hydrolase
VRTPAIAFGMHTISISPAVLDQLAQRGRTVEDLDPIDPRRTAHVVVDLQNGFMREGAPVEVPTAREIVPNVNRISAALKAAGGTNVFLRMKLGSPAAETWRSFWDHVPDSERATMVAAFSEGSPHFALWDGLEVGDDDLVVDKVRFGAFVPGASALHDQLARRHIDTLVITGTLTNVCCESTARDAMQMDYRVVFVSDATATVSDQAHNATLDNMISYFADVVPTRQVVEALVRSAAVTH